MASEEFLLAFGDPHHGIYEQCECGRTYFGNGREGDWNEGEYERFMQHAKDQSVWWIQSSDPFIEHVTYAGKNYVLECGCGKLEAIEKSILLQDEQVVFKFLTIRQQIGTQH